MNKLIELINGCRITHFEKQPLLQEAEKLIGEVNQLAYEFSLTEQQRAKDIEKEESELEALREEVRNLRLAIDITKELNKPE